MTHDDTKRSILHIQNLKLKVNIGVSEEERLVAQFLLLDISISYKSLPRLAITDEITDGYCYAKIIQLIQKFAISKEFKLIEHFAYELKQVLNTELSSVDIIIKVKKTPKIAGFDGTVCFEYGG
jgi:dihydroneopterin aldolase